MATLKSKNILRHYLMLAGFRLPTIFQLSSLYFIFTCGGLARRSISAPCFRLGQRMDFFVSSENISFSVRLAHHGYLDIMDIRISGILGYQGYSDIMDIRISQN